MKAAADKGGFNIAGADIVDPANYAKMDAMVAKMVELRKGKMTEEECKTALQKGNVEPLPLPLVEKLSMATFGSMPKILAVLADSTATSASFWAAMTPTVPSCWA